MRNHCTIDLSENISLVQPSLSLAEDLYVALDDDRDHLRVYLQFVDDVREVADEQAFFKEKLTGVANGTDLFFLIAHQHKIIGSIDLHFIDTQNKKAEIGYWLHSSFNRQGIMTKCVEQICQISFEELSLNKLTIRADVANIASNNVALNCGFQLVCVDHQDFLLYDQLRDMNRYVLLKKDFRKINKKKADGFFASIWRNWH